ncbi:MAG: right-handed parallel beta-helix repeat-containing protein, partial [Planctomycetota bacterium]
YHIWQGSGRPSVAVVAGDRDLLDEARWLVVKAHPFKEEFLGGHLEYNATPTAADLRLFYYNGSNTLVDDQTFLNLNSSNLPFDIAYEDYSGDGLIVTTQNTSGSIYYNWFNSTHGISAKQTLTFDDPEVPHTLSSERIRWLKLVPKPRSDDIALLYSTDANDLYVMMWNGSHFTTDTTIRKELENSLLSGSKGRQFDACFEDRGDQDLLVAYATSSDGIWGQAYDSKTGWTTEFSNRDGTYYFDYITMACKPGSDNIVLAGFYDDGDTSNDDDVVTYKWNGSDGFTDRVVIDTACEYMAVPSEPVAVAWFENSSDSTWDVMVCFNDAGSDGVIDWWVSLNEGVNWSFRADCGSDIINSTHAEDDFLNAYTDPNGDVFLFMQDETTNPDISLMKFDGAVWTNLMCGTQLLEASGRSNLGRQSGMAIVDLPEPETVTSLNTPSPLTVSARTKNSITWSWTDTNSSPNEEGHDIFPDSGTTDGNIMVRCVLEDTTTVVDTGLSANTQISRSVRAYIRGYGSDGNSKLYSSAASASAYTMTGPPTGFRITARDASSISLACDAPPNAYVDMTRVKFECLQGPGGTNSAWLATNTYTDVGLSPDVTYIYRVIWRNGDGIEDTPSPPLYSVGTKSFHLLYSRVSGGSSTYPYNTMATAFNGVAQISDRIAEVNSGSPGGSDYDLVSQMKGSTVIIAGGTYASQTMTISSSFITDATYNITVQNETGQTPVIDTTGSCVSIWAPYTTISGITATGATSTYDQGFMPVADNVTIQYCNASGNYYGIESRRYTDGVDPFDGITIQHCTISNNTKYGLLFWGGYTNLDIYNCSIYNNPEGVRVAAIYHTLVFKKGEPNGVSIRKNKIYENTINGILLDSSGTSYKVRDVEIFENRIYNNTDAGIWVAEGCDVQAEPVIIKNNIIYNTANQDYAVYCENDCDYVQILNNTFYNNYYGILQASGSTNLVAKNNIICIYNATSCYGIWCVNTGSFAETDYNNFYRLPTGSGSGRVGYYNSTIQYTLADWQSATPAGWDTNSNDYDPYFVNAASGEFHLESVAGHWNESTLSWDIDATTSACIDAGDPGDSYSIEPTPNGGCINQGAYGNTPYASKSLGAAPTVTNAHLQTGSSHTLSDGLSVTGGIVAGCTSLYVDYNIITCPDSNPDNTDFILTVTGGTGSASQNDPADSTTPAPGAFGGLGLTGATKLSCTVRHWVKTGLSGQNVSSDYYVKPYTPNAPGVAQVGGSATTLQVDVNPNPLEASTLEYSIQCTNTGQFVQSGGSLGASEAWNTNSGWGVKTVTGLTEDTQYTFRTRSRNLFYPAVTVYSDWSATNSAYTDDTTNPVVLNAHCQVGSAHTTGDGYSKSGAGAIPAATTSLYVDYDNITENNPDYTGFQIWGTEGSGGNTQLDFTTYGVDTTTPPPQQMSGLALNGGYKLYPHVRHYDYSGNVGVHSNFDYYVQPYQPPAPTVQTVLGCSDRLNVTVNTDASEYASLTYGIYCTNPPGGDNWIQAGGTFGASPDMQTAAAWSTVTVTGLLPSTEYTFYVRAYNYFNTSTYNDSPTASATTDVAVFSTPSNFRCSDCSSTTITWAWDDVADETGYDIFDNATDTVTIGYIAQDAVTTVETGLSSNTIYSRYIKAYQPGASSGIENCGVINTGNTKYGLNLNMWMYYGNAISENRGFGKFGLNNLSSSMTVSETVTNVTLHCYVGNVVPLPYGEFDVRAVTSDPEIASMAIIFTEIGSGTVFIDNSTENRTIGYKALTMNNLSNYWIESCISQNWCAIGTKEETFNIVDNDGSFISGMPESSAQYPVLEVSYNIKTYSNKSNVAEACTLCEPPLGSEVTFGTITNSAIEVNVTPPSNSGAGQTGAEFEETSGNPNGDGRTMTVGSYGYTDSGLSVNTLYSYRARYQNQLSIPSAWSTPDQSAYTHCNSPADGEVTFGTVTPTSIQVQVAAPPNSSSGSTGAEFQETTGSSGSSNRSMLEGSYSYTDGSLQPNTTYAYRARYQNGDGIATNWNGTSQPKCTLTQIPTMTNSGSTFSQGQYNIAATVGAAGNPANTVIELFYST